MRGSTHCQIQAAASFFFVAFVNAASDVSMHSMKKRMSGIVSRVDVTLNVILPL